MRISRRRFLAGAGGFGLAGAAVAAGIVAADEHHGPQLPHVELPAAMPGLPARQHAWNATLKLDSFGNPTAPRFQRLMFFDVNGTPTPAHARVLEAALRRLEHAHRWGPDGLLFTAGWGHGYFRTLLGTAAPVPRATALSNFETPSFDDYHLCLHLACDDEPRLAEIESQLLHDEPALAQALRWRETRTGFNGAGLPAARQHVGGIPAGDPVPRSAPLFMGFRSNLKKNQASEDDVTTSSGPLAGGTTMAVSYMRLRLQSWYSDLDEQQRVARMYSPETTVAEQRALTTDAKSNPDQINQAIGRYGVIGHSQTSARARRNNKPIILRRDFNTTDGGQAGLHFVSLQRDIQDFVDTRKLMNAADAQLQNPAITDTVNNGINDFIFVLKRANYFIPSRSQRAFPLLPGRSGALT